MFWPQQQGVCSMNNISVMLGQVQDYCNQISLLEKGKTETEHSLIHNNKNTA